MDRASSGDDAAFGQLARLVQDDLYRFALGHLMNAADAAEATQEALLRAYRKRRRWRRGGDAIAWLYGFAMNVVREFRRKRRHHAVDGLNTDLVTACRGWARMTVCASTRRSGSPTRDEADDEPGPTSRVLLRLRATDAADLQDVGDALAEQLDREAELRRLSAALDALPPRQREAVVCRYLRQMSVKDTAAAMGCAEGTVKAAVFNALENLRNAMKNHEPH